MEKVQQLSLSIFISFLQNGGGEERIRILKEEEDHKRRENPIYRQNP